MQQSMGTKSRKFKIEGVTIVFEREKSRFSIRKNKCYGACSVFLGLTILTLAMAGGNVKAEEVGASNTPTSVEQPAAEVTENTSLVNTDNSSTETDQPASNSEEVTTLQPRAVAPANLVVENMEPKDVSDKIQVLDGKFLGTDKPIDPNQGQNFDFETHFYVGKDVNPKDIFYIKLSDNVSSFGDDSATIKNVEPLVDTTGDIIATGVANAKEKNITYTFTDAVANKNNIIGHIKFPVFIERNKVLQNENVNIEVVVGNSSIVDKVDIRYTTSDDILSVITSVNKKKDGLENNFETTFYINDGKQTLKNGRVELYPYNLKEESPSSVDFSDLNNITYLLYRVPLNYELPPSFGVDFSKLGEPIPIEVSVKVDNKGREYLNFELPAMTSDRYVLTVKAPYKDNDSDIDITGVLYGGKETSATISTHVLKEGVADASTEEAKGYFFEKHIYQAEKLDGQFITNFEEITNLKMGSAVEKFTTQKSNRHPDYQLYAVTSDTKTHFKGDGSQVSNNFINNTTQEVTYYYKKKEPQPLGTVIVRHIEFGTGKELAPSEYATYDDVPAGVPAGSTVAGTGYETKPAQIDGYDLVEVPEDDYGNVFEGITRLTYVYKKQIITGQGEIIDFELESNGDESGQNEQPDEISEHGPLVELEYPSQEGMSGENAGTVEIEESSPIVELDYPSQEGMSGENAGTVEVEENAPIVELDYPSQEGMSGENTGQQTIEEDTPTVTIEEKPVVKPVSSQPSKEELPATGERSETAVTVLGLALSALGLTFIRKRKQN
ncbi:Ig-like domain-containing protein [Streptococcus dysgalactiae]|uniref:Ig-like domain-containing protein n=1 Tax=Streptococcus dysgalactiae TaxID=1334 RepID=UPI0022B6A41F|nr:Ig-like domain-containing protein [Streptococcus dysgalactiae]